MKSKLVKMLVICLIVCGIGAGGYYGYKKYKGSKTTTVTQNYMTVTARKMNLEVGVQGTGAVYAAVSKDIMPNNSGTIAGLNVNLGDSVKKGAKLFTADSTQLKQQADKAQSDLEKQKIQLSKAKNDDDIQTQTLAVNDAQENANYAAQQVSNMTVTSPIDGIVTAKSNDNGDSAQAGKAVLTVVDPTSMKVKVAVDELDIGKVQKGQKADIKFDAIKDKTYEGTVETISPTGTTTNNVTTYDVVVSIANPEGIRLGMNANVNIKVASKQDALVIPAEALIEKSGNEFVMVADSTSTLQNSNTTNNANTNGSDGSSQKLAAQKRSNYSGQGKMVQIKTGLENENYIEVTEGVTEGEKILVQLPQTGSTTTTTNSFGGFGGAMGGFGGNMTGGNRSQNSKTSGQKGN